MPENKFKGWKDVFMEHADRDMGRVKMNWLQHIDVTLSDGKATILFIRCRSKRTYQKVSLQKLEKLSWILRLLHPSISVFADGWEAHL